MPMASPSRSPTAAPIALPWWSAPTASIRRFRQTILPDAEKPQFTGQAVWRYNFPRPADLDALHVYNGRTGVGLVPVSAETMYMYVTTPEPDNRAIPRGSRGGHARQAGRHRAADPGAGQQITDDEGVVYRPLEGMMLYGPWHKGRVVLLGDAVHATTPHLGQGAGMAIEDAWCWPRN
jgi:2-polyprenyl-6-methoxyphenol hydroxylase-like FAD-dependent oxidoreductase